MGCLVCPAIITSRQGDWNDCRPHGIHFHNYTMRINMIRKLGVHNLPTYTILTTGDLDPALTDGDCGRHPFNRYSPESRDNPVLCMPPVVKDGSSCEPFSLAEPQPLIHELSYSYRTCCYHLLGDGCDHGIKNLLRLSSRPVEHLAAVPLLTSGRIVTEVYPEPPGVGLPLMGRDAAAHGAILPLSWTFRRPWMSRGCHGDIRCWLLWPLTWCAPWDSNPEPAD